MMFYIFILFFCHDGFSVRKHEVTESAVEVLVPLACEEVSLKGQSSPKCDLKLDYEWLACRSCINLKSDDDKFQAEYIEKIKRQSKKLSEIFDNLISICEGKVNYNYLIYKLLSIEVVIDCDANAKERKLRLLSELSDDDYNKLFVDIIDLIYLIKKEEEFSHLGKISNFSLYMMSLTLENFSTSFLDCGLDLLKEKQQMETDTFIYYSDYLNKKMKKVLFITSLPYWNAETKRTQPDDKFLLHKLQMILKSSMDLDKIIIGYNTGGHWITYVIYLDRHKGEHGILGINSLLSAPGFGWLNENIVKFKTKEAISLKYQKDTWSCGYYVMLYSWIFAHYDKDNAKKILEYIFKDESKVLFTDLIFNLITEGEILTVDEIAKKTRVQCEKKIDLGLRLAFVMQEILKFWQNSVDAASLIK